MHRPRARWAPVIITLCALASASAARAAEEEVARLELALQEATTRNAELQSRSTNLEQQLTELQRELRTARADLNAALARTKAAEATAEQVTRSRDREVEQLSAALASARAAAATANAQGPAAVPTEASANAGNEPAAVQELRAIVQDLEQQLSAALDSNRVLAAENERLFALRGETEQHAAARVRDWQERLHALVRDREVWLKEEAALKERLRSLEQENAALQVARSESPPIASSATGMAELQAEIVSLRTQLAAVGDAESRIGEMREEIHSLQAQLATANDQLAAGHRTPAESSLKPFSRVSVPEGGRVPAAATAPTVQLAPTSFSDSRPPAGMPTMTPRASPPARIRASPTRPPLSANAPLVRGAPLRSAPARLGRDHVVVAGDTLTRISLRYFGTPRRWSDIHALNEATLMAGLRPGQRLRLP